MTRLSSWAVPLTAIALGLSACGGSGGSGDQLSKSELVSKADAICKDVSAKLDKVPSPKTSADLTDYGNKASSIIKDGANKLDDLNPGSDTQKDFDQFVSAAKKQADLAGQLADAAKSSDQGKIRTILTDARKSDATGKAAAQKVGLKECGKG